MSIFERERRRGSPGPEQSSLFLSQRMYSPASLLLLVVADLKAQKYNFVVNSELQIADEPFFGAHENYHLFWMTLYTSYFSYFRIFPELANISQNLLIVPKFGVCNMNTALAKSET